MINFIKKYKTESMVFVGIFLFWFLISFLTKSMFSGFHLTDDHKLYGIFDDIQKGGLIEGFKSWVMPEMQTRLKPLRMTHLVLGVYFMGLNYTLWSIQTLLSGIITSFLFYLFGREIKLSTIESILFVFFTMCGVQGLIWFHLGYDEMPGMFLLSFALFFMAKSVYSIKNKNIYNVLFVLFTILFSYTKETFILLMPAVLFWKNYLEKKHTKTSWKETILSNKVSNFLILGLFGIDLLIIKLFIGFDQGYVGLVDIGLKDYFKTFYDFMLGSTLLRLNLKYIFLALIILLVTRKDFLQVIKNFLKENIAIVLLSLLVIIPQCIAYAKTGFYPRYALPAVLGYSILTVYLYKFFKKTNTSQIKQVVLSFVVIICILMTGYNNYKVAEVYGIKGIYLHKTLDLIQKETNKDSMILIVVDPTTKYEQAVFLKYYLSKLKNRKSTYLLPVLTQNINSYDKFSQKLIRDIVKEFNNKLFYSIENKANIDAIIVFSDQRKVFDSFSKNIINIKKYFKHDLKIFDVYEK